MTNKIVLASFFELNEKEKDVNCDILDNKDKYKFFLVQKMIFIFFI